MKRPSMVGLERLAQGLSIVTFVLLCWVIQRSFVPRPQCVTSSFIMHVQVGAVAVDNCLYESRLDLSSSLHPAPPETLALVRRLEVLEPLTRLFPHLEPRLKVEVDTDERRAFAFGHGILRLGADWLSDALQVKRALVMTLLESLEPRAVPTTFELETMTDFLLINAFNVDLSASKDLRFSTTPLSFAEYCRSPWKSIADEAHCQGEDPDPGAVEARVWGLRPLLSLALARVFDKLPLAQKFQVVKRIRRGKIAAALTDVETEKDTAHLAVWFERTLRAHLKALHLPANDAHLDGAIKSTLKELEIDSITRWDLTVDLTHTPAWREVLAQLTEWSQVHKTLHTLVFTPNGKWALPQVLPVAWGAHDMLAQKHVLIACSWPNASEAINVQAHQLFARQNCGRISEAFWN